MRLLLFSRICLGLLALSLVPGASHSQNQNQPVSLSFRNDTKVAVIVQSWTLVNNMPRRGQAIQVNPGKSIADKSLPAGTRYVSVYDANQLTRIYLRDQRVEVQRNADLTFSIRLHATIPQRMILNQE
ncbi:MAG: hypothetical protein HY040_14235 [Planctomycetes bacterium]|nr:hypothetical protein [Planctomycetota bacterium]